MSRQVQCLHLKVEGSQRYLQVDIVSHQVQCLHLKVEGSQRYLQVDIVSRQVQCLHVKVEGSQQYFFFFRVLHTIFFHLRAHALARSVTVARSSAVQASSSRRQERRWAIVCGSPQSQSTDWASSR